jgi:REP element-mobilizing transposase RayT
MKEWQSQAHVKWQCKYHVVIAPAGLRFFRLLSPGTRPGVSSFRREIISRKS